MARKTIEVSAMVDWGNAFLRDSEDDMTGMRQGVAAMVERALFETHNYAGFSYLQTEWEDGALREGYDDTRRIYFIKRR